MSHQKPVESKSAGRSPDERRFWDAAFLAAELAVLKNGKRLSPEGAAHLAAEYADAALAERRSR